jgi:hypothetical protein
MQKIFILATFMFLTSYLFSQTEKGKWNLGISSNFGNFYTEGSTGHSSLGGFNTYFGFKEDGEDVDGVSSTNFNLQPGIGYFVVDGLLARLNLVYGYSNLKEDGEITFSSSIVSVGPELRYYFGSSKLRPFVGALANFGSATQKFDFFGDETEVKLSLSNYSGYVGAAYFVSQNASIDLSLGFSANSQSIKDEDEKISFNNIGINFGVNFFF